MKILVVEDDLSARDYIKDAIEQSGHEVTTAGNGFYGLEVYKAFKPDLSIIDIKMPVMDGLELLKAIRNENKDSKIVMMTAYGSEDHAIQSLRLGADDYLNKPIRYNELLSLLKKYALEFQRSAMPQNKKSYYGNTTRASIMGRRSNEFPNKPMQLSDTMTGRHGGYFAGSIAACPHCELGVGYQIKRKSWMRAIIGSKYYLCNRCSRKFFKIINWDIFVSFLKQN